MGSTGDAAASSRLARVDSDATQLSVEDEFSSSSLSSMQMRPTTLEGEFKTEVPWWIILPGSPVLSVIRVTSCLFAIEAVFAIPFSLAFHVSILSCVSRMHRVLLKVCMRDVLQVHEPAMIAVVKAASFVADLLLNAVTARTDSETELQVVDVCGIFFIYAWSGWLLIDLTVAVGALSPPVSLTWLLQLVSVARLVARTSLMETFQFLKTPKRIALFSIARLIIAFELTVHVLACGWRAVGEQGWYSLIQDGKEDILEPSVIARLEGATDTTSRYLIALQETIHMFISGSGLSSVEATNNSERGFQIFLSLVGALTIACVFGSIAVLLTDYSARETEHFTRAGDIVDSMVRLKMPWSLIQRTLEYVEYLHSHAETAEVNMISELSEPLQIEITTRMHEDMIMRVDFFQGCREDFIQEMMRFLALRVYQPHDIVCKQGTVGEAMYFVHHGKCVVAVSSEGEPLERRSMQENIDEANARHNRKASIQPLSDANSNSTVVSTLGPNSHFGDIALVFGQPRMAHVIAITFCRLYSLSIYDFREVLAIFPGEAERVREQAIAQVRRGFKRRSQVPQENENASASEMLRIPPGPIVDTGDENGEIDHDEERANMNSPNSEDGDGDAMNADLPPLHSSAAPIRTMGAGVSRKTGFSSRGTAIASNRSPNAASNRGTTISSPHRSGGAGTVISPTHRAAGTTINSSPTNNMMGRIGVGSTMIPDGGGGADTVTSSAAMAILVELRDSSKAHAEALQLVQGEVKALDQRLGARLGSIESQMKHLEHALDHSNSNRRPRLVSREGDAAGDKLEVAVVSHGSTHPHPAHGHGLVGPHGSSGGGIFAGLDQNVLGLHADEIQHAELSSAESNRSLAREAPSPNKKTGGLRRGMSGAINQTHGAMRRQMSGAIPQASSNSLARTKPRASLNQGKR